MYNYESDKFAKIALSMARQCKTKVGFGAVLVKGGKIIGRGRNRRSTLEDRQQMRYVDYAIHAEQACILDAIRRGHDLTGTEVYVIGLALVGKARGTLTIRSKVEFGCKKCPHAFIDYNIPVNIPHVSGWIKMKPLEALRSGEHFHGNGNWTKFTTGEFLL